MSSNPTIEIKKEKRTTKPIVLYILFPHGLLIGKLLIDNRKKYW